MELIGFQVGVGKVQLELARTSGRGEKPGFARIAPCWSP